MRLRGVCVLTLAVIAAIAVPGMSVGAAIFSNRAGAVAHFLGPIGIAVDASGNVFVGDGVAGQARTRIQKISPSGRVLASWTFKWSGVSQNGALVRLTVDPQGHLWAADTIGRRVLEYSAGGKLLLQFGKSGTTFGQFQELSRIASDPHGNIYVTDSLNNNLQLYSSAGGLLAVWPPSGALKAGRYAGTFFGPESVAVSPTGVLYVVDRGGSTGRVLELSSTAKVLRVWKSSGKAVGPQQAA
jgi:DNA-binding beta-propeller fold protein YncE